MASIRQRGNHWQARVIRKGYPAEVRSFPTREDAVRWSRGIEADIDRGRHSRYAGASDLSLRETLERYLKEVTPQKRGASEEIIRIRALQRMKIASYSLANLSPAVVAGFRDDRLATVSSGTVIRDLSVLSSVINHARREWGVVMQNPCELVRKPRAPLGRTRLLNAEEEARLLQELRPVGRRNVWMKPLVQLALETAMRRGELLALRWGSINLEKRTAHLPMTKNGRPRYVPLSLAAVPILEPLPRSPDGRVFPITAAALVAAFTHACRRAGIMDMHFHDLRHTATTRIAEKLPNVIELAAVTGHQSLQMLKRYYHPKAEDLAKKLG